MLVKVETATHLYYIDECSFSRTVFNSNTNLLNYAMIAIDKEDNQIVKNRHGTVHAIIDCYCLAKVIKQ